MNNKGADRPVQSDQHLCYMLSGIKLAPCKISIFLLVSVGEQAGLNHTWSELRKTCTVFCKCSKISNTFLFLFLNEMLVFRAGIHKKLVRIANRTDPDQTASSEAV